MNDRLHLFPRHLALGAALLFALASMGACGDGGTETTEPGDEEAAGEEHGAAEGDVLVLDTAAINIAGIQVSAVEQVRTTGLTVTGAITYDANRVSHIGSRTDGRIVRLMADIGEAVRGGQPLAMLESPDVGQLRAEENEAQALETIARENYDREARLEAQGISSRKELLEARAELRRAEARRVGLHERLRVLGAGDGTGSQFAITAPFAGIVVAREASLGEMAGPEDQLFTVANLDRVWIELDVFERDLPRVRIGQAVDVTVTAYPGRTFLGRIVYLGAVVDSTKRTVLARVEIPNTDRTLKPGMFAKASIRVDGGGPAVVVVPQDAVQELEGRQVVFVPGDRPGEFRATPVQVGEIVEGNRVTIASGLAPGQRIVIAGAFALRSELAKGEIGEHGH